MLSHEGKSESRIHQSFNSVRNWREPQMLVSEDTPPPCGLFELYMPPRSIWLRRKTRKSHRCEYWFVACHIYVTQALPSFPKQLVSPSARSSGLLMDFSSCRRMSVTDFFFIFSVCVPLHFIEAYRNWRVASQAWVTSPTKLWTCSWGE